MPPDGFFELRTSHLWIAVNEGTIVIIDDDKHKVLWSGQYEDIEWECTPDTITVEMTRDNKKLGSTLITPQAHLIDSLASRAIYLIEKTERLALLANTKPALSVATGAHANGYQGSLISPAPPSAQNSLLPASPMVESPLMIPQQALNESSKQNQAARATLYSPQVAVRSSSRSNLAEAAGIPLGTPDAKMSRSKTDVFSDSSRSAGGTIPKSSTFGGESPAGDSGNAMQYMQYMRRASEVRSSTIGKK
jgi:hypothetical protein